MSKSPKAAPKRATPKKRVLSRWEREKRRRRILIAVIAVVIVAVAGVVVYGLYDTHYKPWHQSIVKVNDRVFDMNYFVKMLRLNGAGQDPAQDEQLAQWVIGMIQRNELVRQEAEELHVDDITNEEIEEELKSQFGFDPVNEDEDAFNQRVKSVLKGIDISLADFKKLYIEPIILHDKVQEAKGNDQYPVDSKYDHVHVRAMLLGTKEKAEEVGGKWGEDFSQLVEEYSPTQYYIWCGYWLVMVLEKSGEGEEEELHIQAILLDSKEKAEEVRDEINAGGDFAELAKTHSLHSSGEGGGDMGWLSLDDAESTFSPGIGVLEINELSEPISQYYPDEPIEWLPQGFEIESPAFEEYAFDEASVGSGVSEPIHDTTYTTTGGYWLVMVLDRTGEGEEEELHVQAILLDSIETVDEVRAGLAAEGDFAELATEHSLHSASSGNGGDMGLMDRTAIESQFGTDNLEEILALGTELSEPLTAETSKQSGYWVIEVLRREGRPLSDDHRDSFVSEYYTEWLGGEMERGEEEGRIKSYLDPDKLQWALDHI